MEFNFEDYYEEKILNGKYKFLKIKSGTCSIFSYFMLKKYFKVQ